MTKQVTTSSVPYKAGGFTTLPKALDYAAKSSSGIRFFDDQGAHFAQASYKQVREEALKLACYFSQVLKIPRGSHIALLAQTRLEFHIAFFACQYAGLLPSPLPYTITLAGRSAYESKLGLYLKILQPALLISPKELYPIAQQASLNAQAEVLTYEELAQKVSSHLTTLVIDELKPLQEDEDAYIQFSSGSTSEPSGLVISQKMIMSNLNAIALYGACVIEGEQIFSWLPYDHDMGLVSFVLSVINTQSNADYITPSTFMRKPALWLELMSEYKTTLTFAPIFAYESALQHIDTEKKLDLSALRIAGIGGDMIHVETLYQFFDKMKAHGFKFDAFSPGYGLAEATLTVSITPPHEPPFIKDFSDINYSHKLVSCGIPLKGTEIQIKKTIDSISKDNLIGGVWVKNLSIVSKSLNSQDKLVIDEEGFLFTGDLGFLHNGHLFITGRAKDIIIIRGRNIWAKDVEWVVRTCDDKIQEQSVVAFGVTRNQQEHLTILLEDHLCASEKRAELGKKIIDAINQSLGIKATLVWISPEQLASTSSGKLMRNTIKSNYLEGKYQLASC